MASLIKVSEKEFREKQLVVASNLLTSLVAQQDYSFMIDKKKRGSIIYNCSAISEDLVREIGFVFDNSLDDGEEDRTVIRKLGEMLKE